MKSKITTSVRHNGSCHEDKKCNYEILSKQVYFSMVMILGVVSLNAQVINFPDANFKAALLFANGNNTIVEVEGVEVDTADFNQDGEIDVEEALLVTGLALVGQNISDLTGIEYFANLTWLNCGSNQLTNLSITMLSQLQRLSCFNNLLGDLDISASSNLQWLDCSRNQLTSLDISNFSQLKKVWCQQNLLNNLDAVGLSELEYMDCSQNQLTTLNLSGAGTNVLNGLMELKCSSNLLTSLNINGSLGLTYLRCANNQFTSLDLSEATTLKLIDCSDNQLTTLDLSANQGFWDLICLNNPSLTYLNLKNDGPDGSIYIAGCPNLQYVCADEGGETTTVQNQINQYGYTNCHVNSYCSFTPGGISYVLEGKTSYNTDNNGCDAEDPATGWLKFAISSPGNSGHFITNASGDYNIAVGAGTHMITPTLQNPSYFTITPVSLTVNFPIQQSPNLQDFCISANGNHPDLEITIVPIDAARPGFDSRYKISCKNKGTITQSGSVHLNFDDAVLDFVSSNPPVTSQSPNVLVLDFNGLAPFQTANSIVTFNANSPTETPALNGGDLLNFTATIVSAQTDETPDDNTFTLHQTVVNSFDPNDKTCLEGATITPEMVGKYVHYLIRFENTGTANAENIVVKDMIDATKFDIDSLAPLDGSHEFVTRINGNKVEFIFENINLPFDDANNDGYVAFKIKTNPTPVLGDTFSNTASIYFDYNFPIVTEPAVTAIAVLAKQDFTFDSYFRIYPNPTNYILKIETKQNIEVQSISIYNTLGQLVLVVPNATTTKAVDVSGLQTGNYFIKIISDKGTSDTKFIKN